MQKKKKVRYNFWDDITVHYLATLKNNEDELGLIIKGHLFVEYILNHIIQKKFKKPKLIFDDGRSNSFSVKLNILYSLGIIPKYLYQNISNVNKIRNQYAHNLKIDSKKINYMFYLPDREMILKEDSNKKKISNKEYMKLLCFSTLLQLRNHYSDKYGKLPTKELDELFEKDNSKISLTSPQQ